MKTYQIRVGTRGSIQEYVYQIDAPDMDDAEVKAIKAHHAVMILSGISIEPIAYLASSIN